MKNKFFIKDKYVSKDFKLSEYFINQLEYMDEQLIDKDLIDLAQRLRDFVKVPITISSGWRSPEKNKKVGGAQNSQHLLGKAIDITSRHIGIDELFSICRDIPEIKGLGDGRKYGFIHIDCRVGNRVYWTY